MRLHVHHWSTPSIDRHLERWDRTARTPIAVPGDWRAVAIWPAARDTSVSASTGIEGNPLAPEQVDQVLAGVPPPASSMHIREVEAYERASRLARESAMRADFDWSHDVIHRVNAAVMEGLPDDTSGDYRRSGEEVHAGILTAPSPLLVPSLMDELVAWLRTDGSHRLVRSALLHLNLIAIHPFRDGNGRTARILSAMELMLDGVGSPELLGIEAYLRRHRDGYIGQLRTSLGHGYDPENHPATEFVEYLTGLAVDRLEARDGILDAMPGDLGQLVAALGDERDPFGWAVPLLAARVSRLRTRALAQLTGRSDPAARAELGQIARRGWLEPQGATRGRWWSPSPRLARVPLRVPHLMRLLADGAPLANFEVSGGGGRGR